jgi:hypothetical protein
MWDEVLEVIEASVSMVAFFSIVTLLYGVGYNTSYYTFL